MNSNDVIRTLADVAVIAPTRLRLTWSDETQVLIDLADMMVKSPFTALSDPETFAQVAIGDWGHSLVWPQDIEIGADSLWLETLSVTGHDDTRRFLEWRLRHGLSLSKAAEALGLSRRTVAYYSNGDRKIPKPILLACRGWESEMERAA
jgi:DNA-binding XRE family transcriptional regulator